MRKQYIRKASTISLTSSLIIIFLFSFSSFKAYGQLYYGGSDGIWTGTHWSPNNTPPYGAPWIAGSAAVFNVPNSKITGATTSFSSITANEDVTVTPSGTIGTNGTVATITVAPGKTFDFGDQAFSTASGTGFIKEGQGVLALNGTTNTYSGGFTLNQGTVIARGVNALGSGQLIINGGTIAANASRNFSGRFTGGIVIGGNFTLGATTGLAASNANLTFSDPVNLGNSTARIITLGGTGVYSINGVISGVGSSLEIAANSAGTLSLGGINTYKGGTKISGGTLLFGAPDVLDDQGLIILNGGTLKTGTTTGYSDVVGTLSLTENSTISLAPGNHTIRFSASNAITWSAGKTLAIIGWQGNFTNSSTGTAGKIFVGANASGLTSAQLNQIKFFDGTYNYLATILSNGEIVPYAIDIATADFRTRANTNSNFTNPSLWEYNTGGTTWVAANKAPSPNNNIIIQQSSVVNLDANISINTGKVINVAGTLNTGINNISGGGAVTVANNGILQVGSTNAQGALNDNIRITGSFTVSQGSTIEFNGTLPQFVASRNFSNVSFKNSSIVTLLGSINIAGNLSVSSGILDLASFIANSSATGGVLTVAGTLKLGGSAGGQAGSNFPLGFTTMTLTGGTVEYYGSTQTVFTGVTYNNLITSSVGTKTAAGSISVGGTCIIKSPSIFSLNGINNLTLDGSLLIEAGSTFDNGGESAVRVGVSNSVPTITINGTFITRAAQGFTGVNAAIPGINPVINDGSTIEFARAGNQLVIARPDYKNITFSNSGVKTLSTAFSPAGTVTIKDNAIVDATIHTFGDANTNLVMTGGRLKFGSTGTKPDIAGSYTLTGGVVEFAGGSITTRQNIRSPRVYFNIEVTGINVGNSLGITTLADGGSFVVKTNGSFENLAQRIDGSTGIQSVVLEQGSTLKVGVIGGFSGGTTAALNGIENLNIHPKATIIYNRAGDQTVTPLTNSPTLLLKGSGIKTVSSGTLTLASAADSLVIDTTVVLKISAGAKVDFNSRPVFIRSSLTSTGMLGEVTDGMPALLNADNVTVERFIPARRAFRLLSPSVTSVGSIKYNWMENQNNITTNSNSNLVPNYGTHITGKAGVAGGFDVTATNNPSLFTFDNRLAKWDSVASTSKKLVAGEPYRILVRGSRSVDLNSNAAPSSNTILRTNGTLFTGPVTLSPLASTPAGFPNLNPNISGFSLVGNPYASSIDWEMIYSQSSNISASYYAFDPNVGVRGAYVSYNAVNRMNQFGNTVTSKVDRNIQPGQAFFVQTSAANPSLRFIERNKTVTSTAVWRTGSGIPKLNIGLYQGGSVPGDITDAVTVLFDNQLSSALGEEDSYKFTNLDENLAINKHGTLLSIEGRSEIIRNDTIRLKMWQYRQNQYYLKIIANDFDPAITAFVKDSYLQSETPVNLADTTLLGFNITNEEASSAPDRFMVIFKSATALPVTVVDLKAYQKEKGIQVEWTSQNESGIDRYEVEKSSDGINFEKISSIRPRHNNLVTELYGWFDADNGNSNNFYRIKIIGKLGEIKYSAVVKVIKPDVTGDFKIYPNPVKGNMINIHLNNINKGNCYFILYNDLGQRVYSNMIDHNGGAASYKASIPHGLKKGSYKIEIRNSEFKRSQLLLLQ